MDLLGNPDSSDLLSNSFADPRTAGLLGMAAGFGQASAPSRLPVTLGQVMGAGAGGMLQGQQNALRMRLLGSQNTLLQQEAQQRALANSMALWRLQMINNVLARRGIPTPALPNSGGGLPGTGIGGQTSSYSPTSSVNSPATESVTRANAGNAGEPAPLLGGSNAGASSGNGGSVGDSGRPAPLLGNTSGNASSANGDVLGTAFEMDLMFPGAGKDIISKQFPGPSPSKVLLDEASRYPVGSPEREILVRNAYKNAGLQPENLRQGGAVFDPVTGRVMFQNPKLPEGAVLNGNGGVSMLPGAIPAIAGASAAQASGPAQFRTETAYGPFGSQVQMPASSIPSYFGRNGGTATGIPNMGGSPAQTAGIPQQGTPVTGGFTGGGAALPSGRTVAQATTPASAGAPSSPQGTSLTGLSVPVQTPNGPKDISALNLDDLFPGGQGIPTPPTPPAGTGYGPPNEAVTGRQKADNELLAGYSKEQSENQKTYQDLTHLQDVLKRGLNTNNLAPLWTDLANTAQGMGLGYLIPKNYDPNDSAVFNKAATDLVFQAVKKLGGQVRIAEIEGYKQASPSMTIPVASNFNIVNDMIALSRWQDVRANLANQYWSKTGGAPLSTFNTKFNQVAPLDALTEKLKTDLRGAGWKFPGDQGTPSGAGTLPPSLQGIKGLQRSPSTGLYRDPATNKIYNSDGTLH